MTVNVMVEIDREISGQIICHAVKFLENVQKRGRLLVHGFNAHDRARLPRNISRKFNCSLVNDSSNAHGKKLREKIGSVNSR